jgi:hypothetical protein
MAGASRPNFFWQSRQKSAGWTGLRTRSQRMGRGLWERGVQVRGNIMRKLKTPHEWARDRTPDQWADHHMKVVMILIALGVFVSYPMGVFVLDALSAAHQAKKAAHAPAPAAPIDGSGVVLSMNDSTGIITIQHSGAPRLGLAPGVTGFRASPEILKRTEVGDQVIFRLAKDGDAYAITVLQIPAFKDSVAG